MKFTHRSCISYRFGAKAELLKPRRTGENVPRRRSCTISKQALHRAERFTALRRPLIRPLISKLGPNLAPHREYHPSYRVNNISLSADITNYIFLNFFSSSGFVPLTVNCDSDDEMRWDVPYSLQSVRAADAVTWHGLPSEQSVWAEICNLFTEWRW